MCVRPIQVQADALDADLLIAALKQFAADARDADLWNGAPRQFAADAGDAGPSCVADPNISKLMLMMLTCRLLGQRNSQLMLVMLAVRVCQAQIFPS